MLLELASIVATAKKCIPVTIAAHSTVNYSNTIVACRRILALFVKYSDDPP
jgi:hypothetical protein